jgi:hypothetical protein
MVGEDSVLYLVKDTETSLIVYSYIISNFKDERFTLYLVLCSSKARGEECEKQVGLLVLLFW